MNVHFLFFKCILNLSLLQILSRLHVNSWSSFSLFTLLECQALLVQGMILAVRYLEQICKKLGFTIGHPEINSHASNDTLILKSALLCLTKAIERLRVFCFSLMASPRCSRQSSLASELNCMWRISMRARRKYSIPKAGYNWG